MDFERTYKEPLSLNPYFFGKCSTAKRRLATEGYSSGSLNPYFFGKCSTATQNVPQPHYVEGVLILIFLENALRLDGRNPMNEVVNSLNPYFFGKCSTARTKITVRGDVSMS